MGLDMYLEAERYIQNWGHNPPEQQYHTIVTNKLGQEIELPCEPHTIVCQIGYWRKANAIHKWFVDNVQDGVDECQRSDVSREQLQDLLTIVNRVLSSTKLIDGKIKNGSEASFEKYGDHEFHDVIEDGKKMESVAVASELLPTEEGCFFGNQDYNQWYYENLEDTKQILEKALTLDNSWDFYYRASW